jgi:hypothetical protein
MATQRGPLRPRLRTFFYAHENQPAFLPEIDLSIWESSGECKCLRVGNTYAGATMSDKLRPTVDEAVRAFLIVCGGTSDIYDRLDRFIAKLSTDPRWEVSEVKEVHRLILERLSA